jgi:hypothetical protein
MPEPFKQLLLAYFGTPEHKKITLGVMLSVS